VFVRAEDDQVGWALVRHDAPQLALIFPIEQQGFNEPLKLLDHCESDQVYGFWLIQPEAILIWWKPLLCMASLHKQLDLN